MALTGSVAVLGAALDAVLDALRVADVDDDVADMAGGVVLEADGGAVLPLEVDEGFGGIGGAAERVDETEALLDADGEPDDVELDDELDDEPDDVELDDELDDEPDEDDIVEGGVADEADDVTGAAVSHDGAALWPGPGCVMLAATHAPGSTRREERVACHGWLVRSGKPVAPVAPVASADVVDDATGVAASVLIGPAAPDPKSGLRCAKPMCSATCVMPGTPPTAAATPENDKAAMVMAATTPTRAGVRLARA